jgi:hypothetical protein
MGLVCGYFSPDWRRGKKSAIRGGAHAQYGVVAVDERMSAGNDEAAWVGQGVLRVLFENRRRSARRDVSQAERTLKIPAFVEEKRASSVRKSPRFLRRDRFAKNTPANASVDGAGGETAAPGSPWRLAIAFSRQISQNVKLRHNRLINQRSGGGF